MSPSEHEQAFLARFWSAMLARRAQRRPAHKLDPSPLAGSDRLFAAAGTLLVFVLVAEAIGGGWRLAHACPPIVPAADRGWLFVLKYHFDDPLKEILNFRV